MRALFVPSGPSPQGWIHTADVRAKMAVSVLASIMTIAISSFTGQAVLALASFCYALTLRRTGVLLAVYALVIAMTLLAFGCLHVMGLLAPRLLDAFEPAALLVPFLRILVMAHVLLPLALSSRLQTMLNTLHGLHLPFCVYLPAAVALRVLPTFWHDIRQVSESLRLRGYRVGTEGPWRRRAHDAVQIPVLEAIGHAPCGCRAAGLGSGPDLSDRFWRRQEFHGVDHPFLRSRLLRRSREWTPAPPGRKDGAFSPRPRSGMECIENILINILYGIKHDSP